MAGEKNCYLGALAPELIYNIFSQLDSVRTLSNLIATFRYVYRVFKSRKERIISRVLQNELDVVLIDARFLREFPYADPGSVEDEPSYWDRIHTAAGTYKEMLSSSCYWANKSVASFAELTELCHTLHKMNFLASTYVEARWRMFGGEGPGTEPPSRVEQLRVLRAFYRRQIVCNAWAPTRREPRWLDQDVAAISNTSIHRGVRLGLFAAFEAWELQQIDHADFFIVQLCAALCLAGEKSVATPMKSAGPSSPPVMVQPISNIEFGDIFSDVNRLVQYIREHPTLADTALHALPLSRRRDREVYDVAPVYGQFLQRYFLPCLRFAWQACRLDRFPDPARDKSEQEQEEDGSSTTIEFLRDAVDIPPFGWVDALDRRYINYFGEALHSSPGTLIPNCEEASLARYGSLQLWRAAGLALWDRRRVEAIKGQEQMKILRTGWIVY